jgi:hypothetical protein
MIALTASHRFRSPSLGARRKETTIERRAAVDQRAAPLAFEKESPKLLDGPGLTGESRVLVTYGDDPLVNQEPLKAALLRRASPLG